ncbi:serine/threonine-protein kinase, partial [Natronoarchaeum mannanilyticum]
EPDEGDATEAVRAADAAGDAGAAGADAASAESTSGESAADGAPDVIPVAPDADVEYADIERGDRLGEGGSAEVFRATIPAGDGEIDAALKEPRMQGTLHADTMESFVEEAETWAGLDDHDFIVGVIDWDAEPLPWMLLEYMDGGDLSNYAGELPFDQAVWTARCVSDGVQHAHSRGVAHLDLKPENVLFRTNDGGWPVPKVADWGLARALLHDDGGVEGLSPRYAAPEQVDADRFGDPDQSTDVYQLGAVFYDLFVGRPPFEGEGGEVLTRVVEDEIQPPSEADPSLPAELDDVLMPALEREKADRYESVLYLRDALADLADETQA